MAEEIGERTRLRNRFTKSIKDILGNSSVGNLGRGSDADAAALTPPH